LLSSPEIHCVVHAGLELTVLLPQTTRMRGVCYNTQLALIFKVINSAHHIIALKFLILNYLCKLFSFYIQKLVILCIHWDLVHVPMLWSSMNYLFELIWSSSHSFLVIVYFCKFVNAYWKNSYTITPLGKIWEI
jgi:hypothetical protein